MGMKEVVTAPRSPWQNPYVERLIGSIRRECLDHIIIFNEGQLRSILSRYFSIITGPGHICHSTRIVRSLAAYSLPLQATSSRSRR
jgi:Integrase core domain